MQNKIRWIFVLAALVVLLASNSALYPKLSDDLSAPPTDGWLKSGGNLFNQNYSPLTQINRQNVANLKGVWRARLEGSGLATKYSGEAQPVVHDGVVYIVTGADDVFAISVKTGKTLWKYEARLDEKITTVCCGWTSRGMSLGEGKIFVGQLDGRLVALDEKSGTTAWSVQAERWQEGYTITAAPLYFDGMVFVGFAGGENGIRGRIKAYDAKDGRLIFSVSMVAIEAKTGKYRWHFQQVHHDIWDYDSPNPVILFDVRINGRLRKAAAEASKTGWVYILDRVTGKPLIGIDEKPVPQEPRQFTSPTQPFPRGDAFVPHQIDVAVEDFPLVNQGRIFTPFWADGVIAKPSPRGGANWPPSSYDPASNYFYVCGTDMVNLFKGGEENQVIPAEGHGGRYLGGAFGGAPIPGTGIFAALDMKTNRLVWQQRWKDNCYSGSVTTAGGLVFVGRNDGRLTALDSSNGKRLWEFQTGAGMNSPVSVFQYEGEEYVVAYSAGSLFAGSPRGDNLWLFSLKGTMDSSTP